MAISELERELGVIILSSPALNIWEYPIIIWSLNFLLLKWGNQFVAQIDQKCKCFKINEWVFLSVMWDTTGTFRTEMDGPSLC